jgi:glucose/mannose-6-phosphate isomerase
MLDDLKMIHQRDAEDALGVAAKQLEYFNQSFELMMPSDVTINNVVLAGMGGSALPGVIVTTWPRLTVPFEIVRGYDIPDYVGPDTLFISSSYSGNTEETLEALTQAETKGAQIAVVASGGKLAECAQQKVYPLCIIPSGIQPRMATFYFVNAFVKILQSVHLTIEKTDALFTAGEWLKQYVATWAPTVPTAQNYAKQIAQELMGKTVIMYAGPKMFAAANKWKIAINENAKNTAWLNQYPEFNHNEFIGWSSHPEQKPFAIVEIRSNLEHPRVQKRFDVTERLLSGKRPAPIVVQPEGQTLLHQLVYSIALGDFVSIYLALLNGVNPTPVDLVERLKTELNN